MKKLVKSFPGSFKCRLFAAAALFLLTNLYAQIPMHYNANSGGIGNSLPFGSALAGSGYKCQWLIAAGEYIQPSPAPPGEITKFYIYINTTGSGTYANLTVKMGQASITSLPTGEYTGPMRTVFSGASVPLTGTANSWMMITLDSAFTYNPLQGLIIDISHCGISGGSGMNVWQTAGTAGTFRRNPIPGTPSCVFSYTGQDTRILQCGVDISPPVGTGNNLSEIPETYSLQQNYPNPFNPATTISFGIPEGGNAELRVYNTLGMEMACLIKGYVSAGSHSVIFDASGLSSGVYYYTLNVNGFTQTKKMLLVK